MRQVAGANLAVIVAHQQETRIRVQREPRGVDGLTADQRAVDVFAERGGAALGFDGDGNAGPCVQGDSAVIVAADANPAIGTADEQFAIATVLRVGLEQRVKARRHIGEVDVPDHRVAGNSTAEPSGRDQQTFVCAIAAMFHHGDIGTGSFDTKLRRAAKAAVACGHDRLQVRSFQHDGGLTIDGGDIVAGEVHLNRPRARRYREKPCGIWQRRGGDGGGDRLKIRVRQEEYRGHVARRGFAVVVRQQQQTIVAQRPPRGCAHVVGLHQFTVHIGGQHGVAILLFHRDRDPVPRAEGDAAGVLTGDADTGGAVPVVLEEQIAIAVAGLHQADIARVGLGDQQIEGHHILAGARSGQQAQTFVCRVRRKGEDIAVHTADQADTKFTGLSDLMGFERARHVILTRNDSGDAGSLRRNLQSRWASGKSI